MFLYFSFFAYFFCNFGFENKIFQLKTVFFLKFFGPNFGFFPSSIFRHFCSHFCFKNQFFLAQKIFTFCIFHYFFFFFFFAFFTQFWFFSFFNFSPFLLPFLLQKSIFSVIPGGIKLFLAQKIFTFCICHNFFVAIFDQMLALKIFFSFQQFLLGIQLFLSKN